MRLITLVFSIFWCSLLIAAPHFVKASPANKGRFETEGTKLCATAKNTLAYLNKGEAYDPAVIHAGTIMPLPLSRIKATLNFICEHANQLNNPDFIQQHFEFIRWYPDEAKAHSLSANKPLLINLPKDRILMTKYYVHLAKANAKKTSSTQYALYGLPNDERTLSIEEADKKPGLTRFHFGKQAILRGALEQKSVPPLAYVSRSDLEAALLQGTIVADFGSSQAKKIFNVHRCNNIPYDRRKDPYSQERYWYFKQVDGVKGYGKDADHKITIEPGVTFAGDLTQLGLGKLLLIQYSDHSGAAHSRMGILADTGGAFADNLYQVDYLAGSYSGNQAFSQATRHLPDYVTAYFMVLKDK